MSGRSEPSEHGHGASEALTLDGEAPVPVSAGSVVQRVPHTTPAGRPKAAPVSVLRFPGGGYSACMQHSVQYARASDGVNIAFCEMGSGEPVIYLPAFPWCHFATAYANPLTCSHQTELSAGLRLITYDARGCGLSDHDACDLTLDGLARDIDAIADALGHSRFGLYGSADGARVMIHYAATRPERVTKLILWLPTASAMGLRDDHRLRTLNSLASRDWEMYVQTVSHAVVGGWDAERAPYAAAWADVMRSSVTPAEFTRIRTALRDHDVSGELRAVQAPTLVVTREHAALYTLPMVREVAAGIPGARLVIAPGNWLLPCTDSVVSEAVLDFLPRGAEYGANDRTRETAPPRVGLDGAAPNYPNGNPASALSRREREVVALMAAGKTNAQIAECLVVSHATASRHVHNILTKLGMRRRSEAVAYAVAEGIVLLQELLQRPEPISP